MAAPFPDANSIPDDTMVWRRIPVDPTHVTHDENLGRKRPSSAAFEDNPDGTPMSVIFDVGQDPKSALEGHEGFALAATSVRFLREQGLTVIPAPFDGEDNHAEVRGLKSKRQRSKIAKNTTWVIPPD